MLLPEMPSAKLRDSLDDFYEKNTILCKFLNVSHDISYKHKQIQYITS